MQTRLFAKIPICLCLFVVFGCTASPSSVSGVDSEDGAMGNHSGQDAGTHPGDMLDVAQEDPGYTVTEKGPFQVGYRVLKVEYAPKQGHVRELDLHLWYPTNATEGENPTYEMVFPDDESIVDAPLVKEGPDEGHPLLIFSHGHRGFGGNASFLMRHFASHGWIAAAPDHTTNTLSDGHDPRQASIYYLRSLDMSAVLDFLMSFEGDEPLKDRVATNEVVMAGHSFGVHTCWATAGATFDMEKIGERCNAAPDEDGCDPAGLQVFKDGVRDERVVSVIVMAGAIQDSFFGSNGHSSVEIPLLSLSGTEDPVGAENQYNRCSGMDFRWVELEGACHQTFGFGGCETLEDEEGFNLVGTYALAFARKTLMNDESSEVTALLEGSLLPSDKVRFHKE